MNMFNKEIEDYLSLFFDNELSPFKLIILWGDKGNGKTYTVHSALEANAVKVKDIIFTEENISALAFTEDISSFMYDEDALLIQCSQLLSENYCLFFQNMEICDLDIQRVLYRLIKYYKNNNQNGSVILEYNVLQVPDDIFVTMTKDILCVKAPERDSYYDFYTANFQCTPETRLLFEDILQITNRNLQNFFTVLKILQYMNVLYQQDSRYIYDTKISYKLPGTLLDLYIDLFDSLKNYAREPLVSTAPFSGQIYSMIVKGIYQNYDRFEQYLKTLSERGCFVLQSARKESCEPHLFRYEYTYADEYARNAVIAQTGKEEIEQIISKYYSHLDRLYKNKNIYNELQDADKILLLLKLTKKHQDKFKIPQISYIAELMKYYYERFMYLNVIKQAESLLENRIVNHQQLNKISHEFWVLFFKSLLAVGNYEKIIGYNGQFEEEDLKFDIAIALYNYGQPLEAMSLLENELCGTDKLKGEIYSLKSSIYDWIGDNKKSADLFKKALLSCENSSGHDSLKYQLFKKYSMFIDFRISECQNKMKLAIKYYKTRNLKQFAECLHNYGTGCVMIGDFDRAEKYLELSIDTLNKICANEIYYPFNSLAILYCHNGRRYKAAVDILKDALKCDIDIAFCELVIHNNLFNIAINMKDIDSAKAEKNILEILFKKEYADLQNIFKERPDIQHPLRQFYYNCALLFMAENNDAEALNYFSKAKECSIYHSVVLYSIEKHISNLKNKLGKNGILSKFRNKSIPAPTQLEKFIYDNDLYLCEIMFWG